MEDDGMHFDTRNKRGTEIEYELNNIGGGLKMAKKSWNYKEMAKAHKRMMQKRQLKIAEKKKERLERKEKLESDKWDDENCELKKKMDKKLYVQEKKLKKQARKKEADELAEKEMEEMEQAVKVKRRKNK